MPSKQQPLTVRPSDEARAALDRLATYHGVTLNAMVEMLIRDRARELFGEDALKAGKGRKS